MDIDDIVPRFDSRTGYNLVDYEVVGLAVWKLPLLVQTVEEQALSPTNEFILKLVNQGVKHVREIGDILGLDRNIVINASSDLIREDAIVARGELLQLTKKGEDIVGSSALCKPMDHTIQVSYDAIVRKPTWFPYYQLYRQSELKDEGVRLINGSPNKAPDSRELDILDIENVIREEVGSRKGQKILRINGIGPRKVLFQKAILLIFKAEIGDNVQVGFVIENRLSDSHEIAFAKSNGPKRLGIEGGLKRKEELETVSDALEIKRSDATEEAQKQWRETSTISRRLGASRAQLKQLEEQSNGDQDAKNRLIIDDAQIQALRRNISELENKQKDYPVRMLPVYEHPVYLWDALQTAKKRILIISPWITRSVVDTKFLSALKDRLQAGVEIHIGYGLDEKKEGPPVETTAEKDLSRLEREFVNLHIKRLGNTHAKILIKDEDYLITSSFNWLSFKGNPKRTFREEWGTYIAISEVINDQYHKMQDRIIGS